MIDYFQPQTFFCRLFGRRTHLSEQIGARRRELYQNDFQTSIDDDVEWDFKNLPADLPSYKEASATLRAFANPIHTEVTDMSSVSSTGSVDAEFSPKPDVFADSTGYARNCRLMELQMLRVDDKSASFTDLVSLYSEMLEYKNMSMPFSEESFLESYLILFQRFQVPYIIDKVYSAALLPTIELASLDLSYQTLSMPLSHDILELRKSIAQFDLSKLGVNVHPIVKLAMFLHHPLLESLIQKTKFSNPPSHSCVPLTKEELKEFSHACLPLNSRFRALTSPLIMSSWPAGPNTVYRIHLISRYIRDTAWRKKLDSMILPYMSSISEFSKINSQLKLALFP